MQAIATPLHAPITRVAPPSLTGLKRYRVTILMDDGSRGRHIGLYRGSCSAICDALEAFPAAKRVIARRLP